MITVSGRATVHDTAVRPAPGITGPGAIHADNRGALRAALAAGRSDVGGWVRVPL
ncbi:MAG: hypothetical protein ACT4RN_17400 [Pseudonocardia sp.]